MGLTEKQVKDALEDSGSYSEAAKRLKVSRQRLWIFCQRHGLSIKNNSKVIARLIPDDLRELKKRTDLIKNRKSGFYISKKSHR